MSQSTRRTFITYVEDRPGVINRVVSLFRRRGYNLDSLIGGRAAQPGVSHVTFVVDADDGMARRIAANLYKLVNVLYVADITHAPSVVREMALLKVSVPHGRRTEVLARAQGFSARVVDDSVDQIMFEATGETAEIDALVAAMKPFGIREMVRTGAVAMLRGQAVDVAAPPSERNPDSSEIAA